MILYSIVPEEVVWQDWEKAREFLEVTFNGVTVQVERVGPDTFRLTRVFSTDPYDYLKPVFQPGTLLGSWLPGSGK